MDFSSSLSNTIEIGSSKTGSWLLLGPRNGNRTDRLTNKLCLQLSGGSKPLWLASSSWNLNEQTDRLTQFQISWYLLLLYLGFVPIYKLKLLSSRLFDEQFQTRDSEKMVKISLDIRWLQWGYLLPNIYSQYTKWYQSILDVEDNFRWNFHGIVFSCSFWYKQ